MSNVYTGAMLSRYGHDSHLFAFALSVQMPLFHRREPLAPLSREGECQCASFLETHWGRGQGVARESSREKETERERERERETETQSERERERGIERETER